MEKSCSQRELHQLCIFSSNFRNNLLCFGGKEYISVKGCIKIEPKLIFSSQSIFKIQVAGYEGWMIEKRWVRWIWVGDGGSLSFPLVLSVVLDFISKAAPFYLNYLKCTRMTHFLHRIYAFGCSRRKIGKRQPERLQKEGLRQLDWWW